MEENKRSKAELIRETIQLERSQIREKIRELIEADYARLEEEAAKIAPEFDFEAESLLLKEQEKEELEKATFAWADAEPEDAEEEARAPEAEDEAEQKEQPETEPDKKEGKKKEYGPLPKARVSASKYPKPAYAPKSAAASALFGDKHRCTLTAALIMAVCFAGYQAWDYLVPKPVNINYVTYSGTEQFRYGTTARTVEELMEVIPGDESAKVRVSSTDLLDTNKELPVKAGMTVEIRQATESDARIAGKKQKLWLVPGTVEENLILNEVQFDEDDEIKPALSKQVDDSTSIRVDEVHYDIDEKEETVESVDRVILDPSLTSGVQETSEGNDGAGIFTYTTKYVNGKDKGTERELKEWITEPHDSVLRLGTSATGNSGEYIVDRTFTANTTAYTAAAGARGALGMGVHVGTCAVDPGFVSLRSELWVEGYGYAFANDTGGAVKGNVVDLYMGSRSACISWGRRNVTAYVIIPADQD